MRRPCSVAATATGLGLAAAARALAVRARVRLAGAQLAVGADHHVGARQGLTLVRLDPQAAGQGEGEGGEHGQATHRADATPRRHRGRASCPLRTLALLTLALLTLALVACAPLAEPVDPPTPDPVGFRTTAYPILLRDCGFAACHGDTRRFFVVFGPARTRLDPATDLDAPVTPEELARTYARAQSMLVGDSARRSLLLRKPLAVDAGGAGHVGTDPWGDAPYTSTSDPSYQALLAWARTGDAP